MKQDLALIRPPMMRANYAFICSIGSQRTANEIRRVIDFHKPLHSALFGSTPADERVRYARAGKQKEPSARLTINTSFSR